MLDPVFSRMSPGRVDYGPRIFPYTLTTVTSTRNFLLEFLLRPSFTTKSMLLDLLVSSYRRPWVPLSLFFVGDRVSTSDSTQDFPFPSAKTFWPPKTWNPTRQTWNTTSNTPILPPSNLNSVSWCLYRIDFVLNRTPFVLKLSPGEILSLSRHNLEVETVGDWHTGIYSMRGTTRRRRSKHFTLLLW